MICTWFRFKSISALWKDRKYLKSLEFHVVFGSPTFVVVASLFLHGSRSKVDHAHRIELSREEKQPFDYFTVYHFTAFTSELLAPNFSKYADTID